MSALFKTLGYLIALLSAILIIVSLSLIIVLALRTMFE